MPLPRSFVACVLVVALAHALIPAAPETVVAPADRDWRTSPYNWQRTDDSMIAVNPGAYFKIGFTGTSAKLNVDVAAMSGASVAAKKYPRIRWSIDGGAYATYQLLSTDTQVSLATGLAAGTHQLIFYFLSSDAYSARYTSPVMWLKVTGLVLDSGATSAAPTLRGKRAIFFGDSISEGAWSLGGPADASNYSNYQDATAAWVAGVAAALGAEYGDCAFGGQGWDATFNSDVPPLPTAWSNVYSGQSRLSGGLFTPAPDYLICGTGAAGAPAAAATVTTWLGAVRAAAGAACKMFVVVPFAGSGRSVITAGVAAYKAAVPTDACYLIDLGNVEGLSAGSGGATSGGADGLHPDVPTQGRLGAMVARAIQAAIDAAGGGGGGGGRGILNGGGL